MRKWFLPIDGPINLVLVGMTVFLGTNLFYLVLIASSVGLKAEATTAYSLLGLMGNFGDFLSGVVAIAGTYYVVKTFRAQAKQLELQSEQLRAQASDSLKAEINREFEKRCESIDIGLSYVQNMNGNVAGGAAVMRYSDLMVNNGKTIEFVLRELDVTALKAVIGGLIELDEWLLKSREQLVFRPIFRVRYMALVLAFERMMESPADQMTKNGLFDSFADKPEIYTLYLAIYELRNLDFYCDTEFSTAFDT